MRGEWQFDGIESNGDGIETNGNECGQEAVEPWTGNRDVCVLKEWAGSAINPALIHMREP